MAPSPEIKLQIDQHLAAFRWEQAGFEHLLEDEVSRDLVRRAIRVENKAKHNATNQPPSQPGHGPAVRTGRLRGSITWRLGRDGLSPYVDVGTAVFYAPFVELGTSRMSERPFLRPALEAARAD